MARNLKQFRNNAQNGRRNEERESTANSPSSGGGMDAAQRANIESMVNEYGGRSEAELMNELARMTEKQKREGSFDPEAMKRTAQSIMPMLTMEQQQKLMAIMSRLGG